MRRKRTACVLMAAAILLCGCAVSGDARLPVENGDAALSAPPQSNDGSEAKPSAPAAEQTGQSAPAWKLHADGATVEERFPAPPGFERVRAEKGSYTEFLRHQGLLPDGSPVRLYDGGLKWNQDAHAAVYDVDTGKRDLQQCADAAMRLRAEYLFANKRYGEIRFHLTNGFLLPYEKYRAGYRLKVRGNDTSLIKTKDRDGSYTVFREYLNAVFTYAGTRSLSRECTPVRTADMQAGDLFLKGGSPGHCVIVADVCENAAGEKAFLLAQGYMPAQQIHILKNPAREEPWYYTGELSYPFCTPEYTFEEECLMRMP